MDFLLKDRSSEIPAGIDDAEKLRREEDAYAHPESDDYLLIFDPHGKMSMLEGGVGCVRLRDQVVEGERVWFMSASSTASAHEGFPVAVPDSLYHSCIDQIATQGVLGCSLVGHLRFVPEPLDPVFDRYVDVPQLYLRVDSLEPAGVAADEEPRVSVAVSFLSDWEGSRAYYASYVTFYPGIQGSLKKRAEWLDEVYVSGMYQGTIVTDFDEQMSRFSDAAFSLDKLMSGKLDESQALDAAQPIRLEGQVQLVVQNVREIHAERLSQVTHKTINIGDGNTINAPIVVAEHVENSFNALAESSVDEGLQAALKELLEGAVALAESGAASDTAEMVARDADSLTREVTGSSPREGTARRILSDLRDTVQAVGEIGQPLLATITKLGPLIAGLFA
ncbi:MAG: hypothetical protein QNK03_28585 [Myxococcota bacterium]|nr:hypothetical protein [Myxococcota bacterium]